MAMAFGVKHHGKILVRTISDTDRAAKVNYLVTRGVWITSRFTDEQIEALWRDYTDSRDTRVVALSVLEAAEQPT